MHGPVPRSYAYALPKKMVLGALRSALSAKLAEKKLTVVDGWELDSHKTKPFREALDKLEKDARTILLVELAAERESGTRQPQSEGVKLVAPNALAAVRFAAARPPDAFAGRGRRS